MGVTCLVVQGHIIEIAASLAGQMYTLVRELPDELDARAERLVQGKTNHLLREFVYQLVITS